jgi:hypothetical protein
VNANPAAPELRALAPGFALAFAGRFAAIVAGLAALIARAFLRHPSLVPLILPLCRRLNHTARRLATLMSRLARHAASRRGEARRAAQRSGEARRAAQRSGEARRAAQRSGEASGRGALAPRERTCPIPTTHAWLVRTLHHEAAAYASQLSHLLSEPGVSDLLDAAPAARRLLRPLCRMLGLSDTKRSVVARLSDRCAPSRTESVAAPSPDTPPAGGVARQAAGVFPFKNPESVLAPSPPPRTMHPPPCPHVLWPWFPRPRAKLA